jgi:hypothetical protein
MSICAEPLKDNASDDDPSDEDGTYARIWKCRKHEIKNLIRSTEGFIVFIGRDDSIDWGTTEAYDRLLEANPAFDAERSARLKADISIAEVIPLDGVALAYRDGYKVLLAESLALALDFDYSAAEHALSDALAFARARNEEKSRLWYLRASLFAALPCVVVGILLVLLRDAVRSLMGVEAYWLGLSTCAGCLGALFSIIVRTGKLQLNEAAGHTTHVYEAVSRIVAGGISGLLVGLAVRSHLIGGNIFQGTQADLLMLVLAMAAGTGERFATSIINKVQPVTPSKPVDHQ